MKNTFQRCAARTLLIVPLGVLLVSPSAVFGAAVLGSDDGFAVLAGTTVTNTGITTINGNIGVDPGSAYSGGGSVTQTGSVHLADGVSSTAQADLTTAYNYLAGLPFITDETGTDLGGLTLGPGVYKFTSSAAITGTLTLDATLNGPNANPLFVFEIASALTTATNAAVNVINGNAETGVYWQVGSSATLGTGTTFAGNIVALTSITLDTGASITCGRALARNGAVTLDASTISEDCSGAGALGSGRTDFGSVGFDQATAPEPGTIPLLGAGLLGLALFGWQTRKGSSRTIHNFNK